MKVLFAASIIFSLGNIGCALAAEPVPCEDLVQKLSDTMKTAKPTAADQTKVADLRKSGITKCKREDDAGADLDLEAALKILSP